MEQTSELGHSNQHDTCLFALFVNTSLSRDVNKTDPVLKQIIMLFDIFQQNTVSVLIYKSVFAWRVNEKDWKRIGIK